MIFPKNRKGVSIIIGYVLLVTFAIIIGGVIYQWLKGYVPTDFLECPDGVSIFINEVSCTNITGGLELDLTIKNNGRFDIAGYFIHATNDSSQELATIDLSKYHAEGGNKLGSAIVFTLGKKNSIKPNDEKRSIFDYTSEIYLIEITPIRFQIEDNKQRLASCGNAKIKEQIICGTGCVPDCEGKICGDDGCGGRCPPDDCDTGYFCNATGNCEEVPATCGDGIDPPCDAGECDSCPQDCNHTDCCGDGKCNNNETCGDTDDEPECNSDCGACDVVCGDGIVESPEQCDTGNLSGGTCESVMGAGWTGDLSCYANCTFNTTGCTEGAACGGWLYEDYCMYAGDFGESCTTVCLTYGGSAGAVNDNVSGCPICYHFYPGASSCGEKPESYLPAYKTDGKCKVNKEFGSWDVDASDADHSRFCACNN
ncbi:hypothetical protein ES703_86570 [subsurface metagenome]